MTRARGRKNNNKGEMGTQALAAVSAPCCCCEEEECAPVVVAPSRSAAAAARYAAMLHWCCCFCLCMCALCGWVPTCDLGSGLVGVEARALGHAGGGLGAAMHHAAQILNADATNAKEHFNVNFDVDTKQGYEDNKEQTMPLAAQAMLASARSAVAQPPALSADVAHALPADAAHSVAHSAGVPVPAASSSSPSDASPAGSALAADFDVAAFMEHYQIHSEKELHDTLLAVEKRAAAASNFNEVTTVQPHTHTSPRTLLARRRMSSGSGTITAMGEGGGNPECEDEHSDEPQSESDKNLLMRGKYALVPVVFFATLASSALPWYMGRLDRALEYIAFGACLAAGVILGAAFSHLLPSATDSWGTYFCGDDSTLATYPWAQFIIAGTILLLITVDSALIKGGIDGAEHGHGHGGAHGHSHALPTLPADYDPTGSRNRRRIEEAAAGVAAAATTGLHGAAHRHPTDPPHVHHHHTHVHVRASNADTNGHVHVVVHAHPDGDDCDDLPPLEPLGAGEGTAVELDKPAVDMVVCPPCDDECPPCGDECDSNSKNVSASPVLASAVASSTGCRPDFAIPANASSSHSGVECCSADHVELGQSDALPLKPEAQGTATECAVAEGEPVSAIEKMRGGKRAVGQAYVFFFALAIHSIFDGLSIGAETDVGAFWALLFAVGGHKLLDGFALGVPIFFAKLSRAHTIFSLVFCAAMTPVGILIGKATTDGSDERQATLARAVILSMSAGTFIFISIVELLPAGLMDGKYLLPKMAVTTLGWGIMALLALWV